MQLIIDKLKQIFPVVTDQDFIGQEIVQIKRDNVFIQVIKWSKPDFDIKIFFKELNETVDGYHLSNEQIVHFIEDHRIKLESL